MTTDNAAPRPFAGQKGRAKAKGADTLLREATATIDVLRAQLRDQVEGNRAVQSYILDLKHRAENIEAHAERLAEITRRYSYLDQEMRMAVASFDQWKAQKEAT